MIHPLKDRLAIDVDGDPATSWPNGLTKLSQVKVDGRPIAVAFFDPRFPNCRKYIDQWRSLGRLAGIRYVPHSWDAGKTGQECAMIMSAYVAQFETDGVRRIDVVEHDIETHDLVFQSDYLLGKVLPDGKTITKGVRGAGGKLPNPKDPNTLGYRWGRPGIWTMEGRQDTTTSLAHIAAQTGLLVGPQLYDGSMKANQWSCWYEIKTWCLNANPGKQGASVPLDKFLPYTDADKRFRLTGDVEAVLFATSRLTELYL